MYVLGTIIGILMILGACYFIYWNEFRAVETGNKDDNYNWQDDDDDDVLLCTLWNCLLVNTALIFPSQDP